MYKQRRRRLWGSHSGNLSAAVFSNNGELVENAGLLRSMTETRPRRLRACQRYTVSQKDPTCFPVWITITAQALLLNAHQDLQRLVSLLGRAELRLGGRLGRRLAVHVRVVTQRAAVERLLQAGAVERNVRRHA